MKKAISIVLLAIFTAGILAGSSGPVNTTALLALTKGGILSEQPLNQNKETARAKDSREPEEKKDPLTPQQKFEYCLMGGIGMLVVAAFVFTAVLKGIKKEAPVN